jgi:multidrug efflux pump subunit AcrA (membrane-fusion protein)
MKHRWIWIILIIILAIVIWKVVVAKPEAGDNQRRPGGMMQAIPVELAPVEIRDMVERSTFSGSLEAKHKFLVAPKVSGQLQKLHVNIGQRVRKGDLLAQLDDRRGQMRDRQN